MYKKKRKKRRRKEVKKGREKEGLKKRGKPCREQIQIIARKPAEDAVEV